MFLIIYAWNVNGKLESRSLFYYASIRLLVSFHINCQPYLTGNVGREAEFIMWTELITVHPKPDLDLRQQQSIVCSSVQLGSREPGRSGRSKCSAPLRPLTISFLCLSSVNKTEPPPRQLPRRNDPDPFPVVSSAFPWQRLHKSRKTSGKDPLVIPWIFRTWNNCRIWLLLDNSLYFLKTWRLLPFLSWITATLV